MASTFLGSKLAQPHVCLPGGRQVEGHEELAEQQRHGGPNSTRGFGGLHIVAVKII